MTFATSWPDESDGPWMEGNNSPRAPILGRAIEFLTPSQIRSFVPPDGWCLVGDQHIQRGGIFVIGGPPGVGKSRAATALAIAGAMGPAATWFGLPIHRQFKTMIVQGENGRVRLRDEYAAFDDPSFDDFIRVCPPPPFGLAFGRPEFRAELAAAIAEFRPDLILVDPWNRVTADDKSKDYLAAFELLRSVLPAGDDGPALGIVCHTRKPQLGERQNGRSLLATLAGGYALGSVPRCAFVMQHASGNPDDERVVWTCCKNNDGALGPPSAWERSNGIYVPVEDFDWDEFDAPPEGRRTVTVLDMKAVLGETKGGLTRKECVDALRARTGCSQSACYAAMKLDGPFKGRLTEKQNRCFFL